MVCLETNLVLTHAETQQQLVAIGYGLYRGDTLVARSRIVRITIVQPLVGDLLALVCEERKLDPDQTRVFESEGDLLDFVKDHKAGEPKVCCCGLLGFLPCSSFFRQALEAVAVCQVGTKYWLWAPEGSVKSDGTPEKKSRLEGKFFCLY